VSSSKRPAILMGILLCLLLAYHFSPLLQQLNGPAVAKIEPPLPGKTSFSNLAVHQNAAGRWLADFDYFYTGEPRFPLLRVELDTEADAASENRGDLPMSGSLVTFIPKPMQRGKHHVSVEIQYPGTEQTTRHVAVTLKNLLSSKPQPGGELFTIQRIDKVIEWPDWQTWSRDEEMARNTPEQNLRAAVKLIDSEDEQQMAAAKNILEKLLSQNPQLDDAYVQLARIAKKSNWGPEGLHQAEGLLASALQIRPDNANAKILLGSVYSDQKRFAQAQELFTAVAASNPPNLWIWSDWGRMLAAQHNYDQAIAKYREALAHPVTHDSYDRARVFAYRGLLEILQQRKDLDGMEVLYKQQVADYGPGACFSTDYARFMLQVRGNAQGAIDLARGALNKECEDSPSREVLGLAEYVKWANETGPERAESLNQARIYLPAGPKPLFLLARSERTSPTIKQLLAAGELIDQKDNSNQTALAYALEADDLGAARRLLTLHAHPDTPVGYQNVPLALVPVIQANIEAIRLMREFGVDYSKLRYRGATALDFAKQSGNHALMDAVGRGETTL
jgi:tetratricopeptide (TPR) repeat protein